MASYVHSWISGATGSMERSTTSRSHVCIAPPLPSAPGFPRVQIVAPLRPNPGTVPPPTEWLWRAALHLRASTPPPLSVAPAFAITPYTRSATALHQRRRWSPQQGLHGLSRSAGCSRREARGCRGLRHAPRAGAVCGGLRASGGLGSHVADGRELLQQTEHRRQPRRHRGDQRLVSASRVSDEPSHVSGRIHAQRAASHWTR